MRARALEVDLRSLTGSGPNGRIVEADVVKSEPKTLATPVARRLAQEHGVDLTQLKGTGPGGRITQDDVLRASGPTAPTPTLAPTPTATTVDMSRVRRITAERMLASAQSTARVTLFGEVDFSEATRFRKQLQPEFERLGVARLPWDAIMARAAGLALQEHPALAAQWADGTRLTAAEAIHVGVAVTIEPEGLVVPVLRNVDTRSLRELAADLLQLVDKARSGRLSPAEMHGGVFTITNLGAYRVDGFTPILNPPETAILGVGRIADRALVVDGKIEVRPSCTLSLSFDHRVVDGAPAAAFLSRLAELLERPYTLLGI
jgi:pyruvate dehydrogenase E2 component (dihydrolipoamide acetyltransferase)